MTAITIVREVAVVCVNDEIDPKGTLVFIEDVDGVEMVRLQRSDRKTKNILRKRDLPKLIKFR